MGTVSASLATHGTTTVRFLNNIFANGTVTATGFSGDGSGLTGITATVGDNSVTSSTIEDGSITGSDLASTLNMTTQAMNIGSITVNAGSFRVDSAGSITASAITSTGTMTIGGAVVRNTGIVLGTGASTHVNLGVSSTTGTTTADADYATVGGGNGNTASGYAATVGGGEYNTASGNSATVGGGGAEDGGGNVASGNYATVGGGYNNEASGYYATVGGGASNTASGISATVGGGDSNTASGHWATVGGGAVNTASGVRATVGGGASNTAAGDYSWAGGYSMQLTSSADNTFVWGTATSAFSIDTADAFLIFPNATGVTGRVGIGTSTPNSKLEVNGGDIRVTGGSFIDDGTTLTVPDYVFDADYHLKPITQVKAYTQEHRHLEGIPDMNDKKGWASLSMQDRDMKLLEKVEELTLYLIQMKEENDAMKARILALETNRMGETCPEPCKVGIAHPTELVKWAKFTQQ